MNDASASRLSFREKAGYSAGDAAANLVFQTMLYFQTAFYTDTFGISAAAAGTLFLLVRVADAIFDPMMGAIADRTNTRWGKFRPWVLWTALPFGIVFWLTFSTPDLGATGKLIYAYATYTALMMIYSANNLPYSALNGVMTGNVDERTSLSSFRFVAAMAASFVVQGLTLPLVAKFGGGDSARGWQITMGLFAAAAVVFFVITFFSARERIQPDPEQKSTLKQDFADLVASRPWLIMFVLTLLIFITLAIRGGTLAYYFKYYVDEGSLFAFLGHFGLAHDGTAQSSGWHSLLNAFGLVLAEDRSNVASVGFSLFNMLGQFVTIIGVLCSKSLAVRFGKKAVFLVGLSLTTFFTAALYFVPANSVGLAFLTNVLWSASYGPTIPLLWAMIADVADYSEWKNSRRATGVVYAGIVFALKAGLGFGGAIAGWVLSSYGYVANTAQSADALLGIRLCATLYPAIPFLIGAVCLIAYPISKQLNLQIQDELLERRKKHVHA